MKRIIIALLALSLIGCQSTTQGTGSKQPSQVVIQELPSETISFVEDFEYLTKMVYETYPYIGMIQRQDIDINRIIKQYRKRVECVESQDEFYDFMIQFTEEFNNNGHMGLVLKEDFNHYYSSYPEDSKWYRTLNNQATMSFYDDYIEDAPESDNQVSEGNITLIKYDNYSTAYLNIESFGSEYIADDHDALLSFYEEIKEYDNLIFDIRNNSGGSSDYARLNIIEPLSTKSYEYENYILYKENDYTRDFISSKLDSSNSQPISSMDMENFTEINLDDITKLSHIVPINHQYKPISEGFMGNIYVLVGPNNYSASEEFIDFCKVTDFATLIGHNTGGDGIGFDPILVPLPHTGILVKYSTHYGISSNGRNSEEFGTTPDVLLDQSENAYEYIMNKIQN
ncbi:hypothetical protein EZV73_04060 [Acidaminobacter sp. JC074]|uniref:S41 family peptidase n=1 Tax=Acidaminobacter sp. JC074 TaxID=2530199 RepID=UPI001F0CE7D7|nr:S41 family peptidase [Acidaminobacter sp. JC074]MCH4886726.1 hypothetical protein [Acidaminobacter sp. JC074]